MSNFIYIDTEECFEELNEPINLDLVEFIRISNSKKDTKANPFGFLGDYVEQDTYLQTIYTIKFMIGDGYVEWKYLTKSRRDDVYKSICNVKCNEIRLGKPSSPTHIIFPTFKSKTEELFYMTIMSNKISIDTSIKKLKYTTDEELVGEKDKYYIPDFYIRDYDLYVDISEDEKELSRIVDENRIVLNVKEVKEISLMNNTELIEYLESK